MYIINIWYIYTALNSKNSQAIFIESFDVEGRRKVKNSAKHTDGKFLPANYNI